MRIAIAKRCPGTDVGVGWRGGKRLDAVDARTTAYNMKTRNRTCSWRWRWSTMQMSLSRIKLWIQNTARSGLTPSPLDIAGVAVPFLAKTKTRSLLLLLLNRCSSSAFLCSLYFGPPFSLWSLDIPRGLLFLQDRIADSCAVNLPLCFRILEKVLGALFLLGHFPFFAFALFLHVFHVFEVIDTRLVQMPDRVVWEPDNRESHTTGHLNVLATQ